MITITVTWEDGQHVVRSIDPIDSAFSVEIGFVNQEDALTFARGLYRGTLCRVSRDQVKFEDGGEH